MKLETVRLTVPEEARAAYEAALTEACDTLGSFRDEATGLWTLEGVRSSGDDAALAACLALAALATGHEAAPVRERTEAGGWLEHTRAAFPEQLVGRFLVRGTHLPNPPAPGRVVLVLDAGVAFGSGEHGSTRGCLRALERLAPRRPRRAIDLGTGSGILAMAAVSLWRRPVLATDIDPWSVRSARENAARNRLARWVRVVPAPGWRSGAIAAAAPFDLVVANILARPLCRMAADLARHLAPGGRVILSGLLHNQRRWVLAAHRRHGLVLERVLTEGAWATLILRKPSPSKG